MLASYTSGGWVAGVQILLLNDIFFVTEFAEFSEKNYNHLGKTLIFIIGEEDDRC